MARAKRNQLEFGYDIWEAQEWVFNKDERLLVRECVFLPSLVSDANLNIFFTDDNQEHKPLGFEEN